MQGILCVCKNVQENSLAEYVSRVGIWQLLRKGDLAVEFKVNKKELYNVTPWQSTMFK